MIKVVTTFSKDHAPIYGSTFLKEAAKYGLHLTLVHHSDFSGVESHGEDRIDASRGGPHDDVDLWRFREFCAEKIDRTNNYRFQAARFGWKVFSKTRKDIRCGADWLIWIDSDVRVFAKPNFDFLDPNVDVAYLGRRHWDHSECGFVAYNLTQNGGALLDKLRHIYVSGRFMEEREFHDSWLFDRVRERGGFRGQNISPNAVGLDAWPFSPLASWSDHLKGNRKWRVAELRKAYVS